MQVKLYLVLLATAIAGSAAADARFSTNTQQYSSLFRLEYAQVQIDDLAQRDLRRMIYYADRATGTLQTMVEGADARSIYEQDKVNSRFRESLVRLAGAGARSGLSMDQVAVFYHQIVVEKFGQAFMQQVGEMAGGLDFRTLFRNVATVPDPNDTDARVSFVDALAEESKNLQLDTPFSENNQVVDNTPVADGPVAVIDGPIAFSNANAIELNVVRRVQVIDGRWELTVRAGDSLSTIASAIYGNALSYTIIQRANTEIIRNPNVIDVGILLVLPMP